MIGVTDVVRCIKPFWDNMSLLCQDAQIQMNYLLLKSAICLVVILLI